VLGDEVVMHSFAVIGGEPQDLGFDPAVESRVRIGAGTMIREGVTLHRSTEAGGETRIGEHCLLMANAHAGHDCQLGDRVILANNVMLGGHVAVGARSFLGGGCGVHQFVRIGELVMVGGNASITYDVPSYLMVAERNQVSGLNLVGLKRNCSSEAIRDLRRCYKGVYLRPGNPARLAAELSAETPEGRHFLDDFSTGTRGRFVRSRVQS